MFYFVPIERGSLGKYVMHASGACTSHDAPCYIVGVGFPAFGNMTLLDLARFYADHRIRDYVHFAIFSFFTFGRFVDEQNLVNADNLR